MPDSTADNATRALWAEAFFGIAVWITHVQLPFVVNHDLLPYQNSALRAGADRADLVQEVDRAYAIVATVFPPSTTDWPAWAHPLIIEAAGRAGLDDEVQLARARVENLRQAMAKLRTSQKEAIVAGESADRTQGVSVEPPPNDATVAIPPAAGKEELAPQGQDIESNRKRSREEGLPKPTPATSDNAMPPAKRRAPNSKGRKRRDVDAPKRTLTDRAVSRSKIPAIRRI